jgi:hypothetical protein
MNALTFPPSVEGDEDNPEFRKFMQRLQTESGIYTYFREVLNADETQSLVASKALLDQFVMKDGVALSFKIGNEVISARDSRVAEAIRATHAFLLPSATSPENPLAHTALTSTNMTERAALVKQIGYAKANELAQSFGLTGINDRRAGVAPLPTNPDEDAAAAKAATNKPAKTGAENPWAFHPQNCDPNTGKYNANALSRQSFLAKVDLRNAQNMAQKVGRKLGDTKAIVAS